MLATDLVLLFIGAATIASTVLDVGPVGQEEAAMSFQHVIGLCINISMFAYVLAIGLAATPRDATYLFTRRGLFLRSILSMNVVMTAAVVVICLVFDPVPEIKVALLAIALSPVPPLLPGNQIRQSGEHDYPIGLLVAASIASVVVIPLGLLLLNLMFGLELRIAVGEIAGTVMLSILVPLFLGIVIRQAVPRFARRVARPLTLVAICMLVLAIVPVLVVSFPAVVALLGDGLIIGLILFAVLGLVAGHLLGGPNETDRPVLALASCSRHPAIAIAIASLNYPDIHGALVVVLYHLLFGLVAGALYSKWRTGRHAIKHREAT